ncbi:HNH endonuclease [Cryobacterium sp. 10S3]
MDHLLPRSKGGTWDRANLAPAHYGCNSGRGNRDLPEPERIRSREW